MNIDVVYGSALWHAPTKVNCHFVAERLADRVPLVYVESVGARLPRSHEWKRIIPRLLRSCRPLRKVANNLWILSPLPLPAFGHKSIRANSAWVALQVRMLLGLRGWRVRIAWIFHPMGWGVAKWRGVDHRVYYCVDDYSANPGVSRNGIRQLEAELAALADVTIVTGDALGKRLRDHARDIRTLPNVADTALFTADHSNAVHDRLDTLDTLPHPRVGYIGNLASYKIDLQLIHDVAHDKPDWSFVLVGPRNMGDVRETVSVQHLPPNVHVFDAVPHALTPAVIDRFDVCILPAANHPVMRSSFPLKFFEYLLRERPVVSKPLPALEPFSEWFFPAETAHDFGRSIEQALSDSHQQGKIRQEVAQRFSWDNRAKQLHEIRRELLNG